MIVSRCEGCGEPLPPSRGRRRWHEACRKRQYRRRCECGARTVGVMCERCRRRQRHEDARARVLDAMCRWHKLHHEPPKAQDWNPAMARRRGNEPQAQRAAGWPNAIVVARLFGSWNKAVAEAGFTPRSAHPE